MSALWICLVAVAAFFLVSSLPAQRSGLRLYSARQLASDLEVTGMIPGVAPGSSRYVTYAELSSLPQITTGIDDGSDLVGAKIRVTGVSLEVVAAALGVTAEADLIDALCTDRYRSHYPTSYIAAHHPILGLRINGLAPSEWAVRFRQEDPGPYFIVHAHFVAAFRVLSHADEAQIPTNVIRLNFTTAAATYGVITPRGASANDERVQQGFVIAKQNCLRCHFSGAVGGTKSGHDWLTLSTWAREQPAFFSRYIHDPRSVEDHAHMPAMKEYDAATLAALTAYFRTFTEEGVSSRTSPKP